MSSHTLVWFRSFRFRFHLSSAYIVDFLRVRGVPIKKTEISQLLGAEDGSKPLPDIIGAVKTLIRKDRDLLDKVLFLCLSPRAAHSSLRVLECERLLVLREGIHGASVQLHLHVERSRFRKGPPLVWYTQSTFFFSFFPFHYLFT